MSKVVRTFFKILGKKKRGKKYKKNNKKAEFCYKNTTRPQFIRNRAKIRKFGRKEERRTTTKTIMMHKTIMIIKLQLPLLSI